MEEGTCKRGGVEGSCKGGGHRRDREWRLVWGWGHCCERKGQRRDGGKS